MRQPTLREELEAAINPVANGRRIVNMDEVIREVKATGQATAKIISGANVVVRRQWVVELQPTGTLTEFMERRESRKVFHDPFHDSMFGTPAEIREAVEVMHEETA